MPGTCCPECAKIERLMIGGERIGISGLLEAFEKMAANPRQDEAELRRIMMAELKKSNYIPTEMESEYEKAAWERYLESRAGGK